MQLPTTMVLNLHMEWYALTRHVSSAADTQLSVHNAVTGDSTANHCAALPGLLLVSEWKNRLEIVGRVLCSLLRDEITMIVTLI